MSSITSINNNARVVNVGRTTPVAPGPQPASRSIPVVLATDQTPIPVEEQNKIQSEVALSLLGIPRAEVALGIFADVNTYDVNPTEWSLSPQFHQTGHGIQHRPTEAGALVEAPRNKNAVLTSKRFFRYQPGRVSAATFGIKSTTSISHWAQNQVIRKFGIYDNYDGYYWETRQSGEGDNFSVVRRTQSLFYAPYSPFGVADQTQLTGYNTAGATVTLDQIDDYRISGKAPDNSNVSPNNFERERNLLIESKFEVITATVDEVVAGYTQTGAALTINGNSYTATGNFYTDLAAAINAELAAQGSSTTTTAAAVEDKCARDIEYWLDVILLDIEWGGDAHTKYNITNFGGAAILADPEVFENPMYNILAGKINALYDVGNSITSKVTSLVGVITGYYSALIAGSIQNTLAGAVTYIGSPSLGSKTRTDTFYDAKKHYWGYYVAKTILDDNYVVPVGYSFSLEELRNKCRRDLLYAIEGFRDDIEGGGNASTRYNASMFHRGFAIAGEDKSKNIDGQAAGLAVYSQKDPNDPELNAQPIEVPSHEILRDKILNDLVVILSTSITSQNYIKQQELSNFLIDNFITEKTDAIEVGSRGYYGNLVVMRDGLIMTHAAVYDTSLLKPIEKIKAKPSTITRTDSSVVQTLRLTKGIVTFGQHVKLYVYDTSTEGYVTATDTSGRNIYPGHLCQVQSIFGDKGNEFSLKNPYADEILNISDVMSSPTYVMFVETVVPFIIPDKYDPAVITSTIGAETIPNSSYTSTDYPTGAMFPYMYAPVNPETVPDLTVTDTNLTQYFIGYINTALELSNPDNLLTVKGHIDSVNFIPEYINWIKNNVSPEYYGAYEYRVPRSRFTHDKLDGKSETAGLFNASRKPLYRVYSDVATGETGIARPGQIYTENGTVVKSESEYQFDFTKVTMLKVEFSWYGAVGALFLAYVPVGNGEARWVRVHHLRASNQLKIASLGNATLPITYNVYGGGDFFSKGDGEEPDSRNQNADVQVENQGYSNPSHNLVKYGASYYIDGGDRGTVRLFSYNNDDSTEVYGKKWLIASGGNQNANLASDPPYLDITGILIDTNDDGIADTQIDPRFFMNAKVSTSSVADQSVSVYWTEDTGSELRCYLSNGLNSTSGDIFLIPDRSNSVYGIETKKSILSTIDNNVVRNRVQVYPTKMSTANLSTSTPMRLRLKKTPLFQSDITPVGSLYLAEEHIISAANNPLPIEPGSSEYIQNGDSIYGWFKARIDSAFITVFGSLYKDGNSYYFELLESYNGVVRLLDRASYGNDHYFLADGRFTSTGQFVTGSGKLIIPRSDGLTSIDVVIRDQTAVPKTGTDITTIYLRPGTEQIDLLQYFDYNKEYLSFPLTDRADTLYLQVDMEAVFNQTNPDRVNIGLTWEEQ